MKILILTLPGQKERQEAIRASINKYGYDYEFIFNEANIKPPIVEKISVKPVDWLTITYDQQPTVGEWGCKLGHMAIYKEIIKKGWDNVLILEDDALWRCDIPKVIEATKKEFPCAELITGCIWKPWWIDKDSYAEVYKGKFQGKEHIFHARHLGYENLNWYYNPVAGIGSTACYWLNLKAARKLLAANEKYPFPIDVIAYNWNFHDTVIYRTKDVLIDHGELPSVIQALPDGENRYYSSHTIKAKSTKLLANGRKLWWGGIFCTNPIPYRG